jgi:hypothetical protein
VDLDVIVPHDLFTGSKPEAPHPVRAVPVQISLFRFLAEMVPNAGGNLSDGETYGNSSEYQDQ